jgi:Diacylglycerol kinase accessory domain
MHAVSIICAKHPLFCCSSCLASHTWPRSLCVQLRAASVWRRQLLSVQGSWHLGQVQVGLSQARRLCRCSRIRVTLAEATHMQVPALPGSTPMPASSCHLLAS